MSKAMTWRRSDANRKCRKKPMGKQNMSCRCEFSICRTMGEWQKKRRQRIEERRTLKIWLIQKIKGNDERIIDVYIEIPWAAAIASCRRRGPRFWTMLIPKVFACCICALWFRNSCWRAWMPPSEIETFLSRFELYSWRNEDGFIPALWAFSIHVTSVSTSPSPRFKPCPRV